MTIAESLQNCEDIMNDLFSQMATRWPSPIVARREIRMFTGGAISPKHLANLDSQKNGPPERIVIGGHVCYPVNSFVEWLRARAGGKP